MQYLISIVLIRLKTVFIHNSLQNFFIHWSIHVSRQILHAMSAKNIIPHTGVCMYVYCMDTHMYADNNRLKYEIQGGAISQNSRFLLDAIIS